MLGIADYGAFVAAVAVARMVPQPGPSALPILACCPLPCAFAHPVTARVRAHRKAAQSIEPPAGGVLAGFGIELAQ